MIDRRERLLQARLYLVCDARPEAFVDAALRGGVDLIQLRCKESSDREIVAAARATRALCHSYGALMLINDRTDLVLETGADGVHVGQEDMPTAQARALIGVERLLGLSTHTPAQIDAAAASDADYIGVGPVHATPTKPGRAPVGLELVRYAAANSPLPFFAIGGIDTTNAAAVHAAGATRIAVVRALVDAHDPEAAARRLRAGATGDAQPPRERMREVSVGAAEP